MQKGYSQDFKNRDALLKLCMESGMSYGEILKIVEPMHGKTPEEKEIIAEQILREKFNIKD